MPGARRARSLVRVVKSTRVSHHGHTGIARHSPRNGFNDCFALSRVTGLSCHPRPAESCFRNLTPASGRQDHTTSPSASRAVRLSAPSASTASRPASVTIASRPSVGRDGRKHADDLGQKGMEIFLRRGLDRQITFFIFSSWRGNHRHDGKFNRHSGMRPLGAGPESILPVVVMDSGLALRAPRNDGGYSIERLTRRRHLNPVSWKNPPPRGWRRGFH